MNAHPFLIAAVLLLPVASAAGQSAGDIPTSSRVALHLTESEAQSRDGVPHYLNDSSMIAVAEARARVFQKHDLIQIVVQESSKAESTHELDTEKKFDINAKISAWPDFNLSELLQLQLLAGGAASLPELKTSFGTTFEGEGDYKREDKITTRLSAEVIAIRPNGNLVIEARTFIKTDDEEVTIKVTGECRPEDVDARNALLSNRIHDLKIEKSHRGELREANEKGFISKVFDTIFAF